MSTERLVRERSPARASSPKRATTPKRATSLSQEQAKANLLLEIAAKQAELASLLEATGQEDGTRSASRALGQAPVLFKSLDVRTHSGVCHRAL